MHLYEARGWAGASPIVLLPHAHAQGVKQSVLSVVGTKIATSRDLGISATYKHNESVEIGENWLQCLAWPTSVTNSAFLLATPIDRAYITQASAGHVLSAHAHNSPSISR